MKDKETETFSPEETAVRRDAVVRRMANTPPRPKAQTRAKAQIRHPRKRKRAVANRAAGKGRVGRER